MFHGIVGARSIGIPGLLLACLVTGALFPAQASAQKKPSNNMWTRSAALYLDRAQRNARAEERRELWQQALEAVKEGIEQDPENPRIWFLAGQTYVQMDSIAQADAAFTRAQEMYPDYAKEIEVERRNAWVRAYNNGVGALQQQDVDLAISLLEKADLIYDGMPMARLQLGALYAQKGQTDQAIEAYRGALEILRGPAAQSVSKRDAEQWRENEEVAAFNMAQLLAGAGRDEEAAQAYRDFLERDPQNKMAKVNLAVVLGRLGRKAEAGELYSELMSQGDLSASELFSIGIGLFNGDQFTRAAEAFHKSLEQNPYSRDALYNLSQALYQQSVQLEEVREKASGDEQMKAASDLGTLYEELRTVAEQLRGVDPNNRNVLLLLARAYRGLADATEGAASDEWRNKALGALQQQESLPFEVDNVMMVAGEGSVTFTGSVVNLKLQAGTPVRIRMIARGEGGAEVGSQEVTVEAPEAEQSVSFEAVVEVSGDVLGWTYEVAG